MKIKSSGNSLVARLICGILAIFMFFALFLPAVSIPSPEDYLEDVVIQVLGGRPTAEQSQYIKIINDLYDTDGFKQILNRYSQINISSLGQAGNGYGYFTDRLAQTITDYTKQFNRTYMNQINDLLASIMNGDSTQTKKALLQLEELIDDPDFQILTSDLMFCYTVYWIYQLEGLASMTNVDAKDTVNVLQDIAARIASGRMSPIQMLLLSLRCSWVLTKIRYSKEYRNATEISYSEENSASEYVDPAQFSYAFVLIINSGILAVQIFSFCFLLLILLYVIMTIRLFIGSLKRNRQMVHSSAVLITVLAFLHLLWIFLIKLLVPIVCTRVYSTSAIINALSVRKLFCNPNAWLYITVIAGIAACVVERTLWDKKLHLPQKERRAPKIPKTPKGPKAGKWVCVCGCLCEKDEAFCPQCGCSREKVMELTQEEDAGDMTVTVHRQNDKWSCPHCGAGSWESEMMFCPRCGQKRPEQSVLRCSCGAELLPDAVFCSRCGKPVNK